MKNLSALSRLIMLLDGYRSQGCVHFATRAAALVEARGPKCYEPDFEKVLLVVHAGSLVRNSCDHRFAFLIYWFLRTCQYTETVVTDAICFLERES